MSITIVPLEGDKLGSVRDFNSRIQAAGWGEFALPTDPTAFRRSHNTASPSECWLAEARGAVRGGYCVRHQQFSFRGTLRTASHYSLSISEGVVDKTYSGVGPKMVLSAVARQPRLFALGMGGLDRPLPRLLKALGWFLHEVPFYFQAIRPGRVLRNIRALRTSMARRLVLDVSAYSGAASLGVRGIQWVRRARGGRIVRCESEQVDEFGPWADRLWEELHAEFAMIGDRRSEALNVIYPPSYPRLVRLKLSRAGHIVGWVVVMLSQTRGHKHFGDLRVGTIVDGLAASASVAFVIDTASRYLVERGADLVISNQTHHAWCAGLERSGFLRGPSNYIFAASKGLAALLSPFEGRIREAHINRGDGDGPIHL